MGLFDPWTLGQQFGGLLGGFQPDPFGVTDVDALIRGNYASPWRNVAGESPQIPADPSGSAPLGAQAWNSPLMPQATSVFSTEPAITNPAAPQPGSMIRPGSILDRLLNSGPSTAAYAGGMPTPKMPAQPSANPADYANLRDAFGTEPAPQSQQQPQFANVPLPRPRPEMAEIPPAAAPTSGQSPIPQAAPAAPLNIAPQLAPQQQPLQQMQLPPALGGQPSGFLDSLNAGLQSIGHGGSLLGVLTGNRTDAQSESRANLKAEYDVTRQTLIDNGYEPQKAARLAMLAVMNKDAGKTIIPEALSSKENYQVVREDPLTGKEYGFVNNRNQTINGKPISAQAPTGGGGMQVLQAAQNAGVTGEALYQHLPTGMAPVVKAMIEGRQPMPSTVAMRSPAVLAMIDAAHAIDPTFDATSWATRLAGRKDFEGGGKSSEMVRAANQTLSHVGSLMDAMEKLKNRRIPAWNTIANTANEMTGGGEPGAFRTNAHAVAEEMSKVFKGANLSDAEIRHWEKNLSEDMSPEQQKTQIAKLAELLHGSLHALEEKRVASIGPMAAAQAGPLIKPEGQAVLKRIEEWTKKNGGASSAVPAASGLPPGWSVKVN